MSGKPQKLPNIITKAKNGNNKRRFALEYLIDGNAKQAAIRAGYSPRTAKEQGCALFTDPNVKAIIEQGQRRLVEATGMSAELVYKTLERAMRYDPRKLFDEEGELKPITDLDDDTALAITSVEVVEKYCGMGEDSVLFKTRKVRGSDRIAAASQAAKILKLEPAANLNVNIGGKPVEDMTEAEVDAFLGLK
jgi:phage terminase small subunit